MGDTPEQAWPAPAAHEGEGEVALDRHVAEVGSALAKTIGAILQDLDGARLGPSKLARRLGISQPVSSRLYKASASRDPIETVHLMPGPESLRRLSEAARRSGVDEQVIRDADESIRQFEGLIRDVAGDRSGLNTIIGAWLPDVREKADLVSRQWIYKGMSQIQGASADVEFVAQLYHPGSDGARVDSAVLSGLTGLTRMRPGVEISNNHFDLERQSQLRTLNGRPVNSRQEIMLPQFCSTPTPELRIRQRDGVTTFRLASDQVGLRSAVNLVWAHALQVSQVPNYCFVVNELPAKKTRLDVLVHKDCLRGAEATPHIYSTAVRGITRCGDPTRNRDRLALAARVEQFGIDDRAFCCGEVPRYRDMIRHVCEKMQWDVSAFQCYRLAIEYPVYGSQAYIGFGRGED